MNKHYGMLIDLNRCIGCQSCIVACKQENDLPPKLYVRPGFKGFSHIRVLTVGPQGKYPNLTQHYLPIPCMHCEKAPCVDVCPTGAIYRNEDGLVLIQESECTGCEECIGACPYGAMDMDRELGVARKCTFCEHLVKMGEDPACVKACNAEALIFGDLADTGSDISTAIREAGNDLCIHKSEVKSNPSVSYLKYKKAVLVDID